MKLIFYKLEPKDSAQIRIGAYYTSPVINEFIDSWSKQEFSNYAASYEVTQDFLSELKNIAKSAHEETLCLLIKMVEKEKESYYVEYNLAE